MKWKWYRNVLTDTIFLNQQIYEPFHPGRPDKVCWFIVIAGKFYQLAM